jgi:hypothetical protein
MAVTFEDFKFNRQILNAIADAGYTEATPIQQKAIPPIMNGQDVMGIAQTGTGKTAAYVLPILMKLKYAQGENPRALIVSPTRELAMQIEDIIEIGCERILTSGGKSTAMEGATVIAHLMEKAAGRIAIMPGSGITENNVADLVHFTGVTEVHSSARVKVEGGMQYKNDHILLTNGLTDEYSIDVTGVDRVKEILKNANG